MPDIFAFRGLRYDLGHVGALEGVVAPQLELIDASMQRDLYQRHPANVIRLIENRSEPGDAAGDEHARAGLYFRNWQREGVLQRDPAGAIYVYHVVPAGAIDPTQRGMICLLGLEPESDVWLDENDVSTADVEARLSLLKSADANLVTATGVFSSLQRESLDLLELSIANVAPIETQDAAGARHRIWPVTDMATIQKATSAGASMQIAIVGNRAEYLAAQHWSQNEAASTDPARRSCVMVALFESDELDPFDQSSLADVVRPQVLNGLVFYSHRT